VISKIGFRSPKSKRQPKRDSALTEISFGTSGGFGNSVSGNSGISVSGISVSGNSGNSASAVIHSGDSPPAEMAFGSSGAESNFGANRKEIRCRPKWLSAPTEKRFGAGRKYFRHLPKRDSAPAGGRYPALRIAPETRSGQARASLPTGCRFRVSGAVRRAEMAA
jgi:hypothetical protein